MNGIKNSLAIAMVLAICATVCGCANTQQAGGIRRPSRDNTSSVESVTSTESVLSDTSSATSAVSSQSGAPTGSNIISFMTSSVVPTVSLQNNSNSSTSASSSQAPVSSTFTGNPITLTEKSEVDLLPKLARDYLKDADNYDINDFSTTIATSYIPSGVSAESVVLYWKWNQASDFKPAKTVALLSENSDMSNAREMETQYHSQTKALNLQTGKQYYWQVKAESSDGRKIESAISSFKVAEGVRPITLEGVGNARDLGTWKTSSGKTVKQGLLYRSAQMDGPDKVNITDAGIDAAINQLGIKTDLDFRKGSEITADGSIPTTGPLGPSVNYKVISIWDYSGFLSNTTLTAEALKVFADYENYPILFHCRAGADRTGSTAFMINAWLGVSELDLIKDYELTNNRDRTYGGFPEFVKTFRKFDGSTTRDKAYTFMHDKCKLTDMELSNIYNIMLTDSAVFDSSSLEKQSVSASGKLSLKLNLRDSGGVKSVTFNGSTATHSMSGSTLTVTVPNVGKGNYQGEITLNDGEKLTYEVTVK